MAKLLRVSPYADDEMNLPVKNVDEAVSFYESVMGFEIVSRNDSPRKSVVLARDGVKMAIAENGGDPTQEGCFFEVDNAEELFAEFQANGLKCDGPPEFRIDQYGEVSYKVFFIVAPDDLCYCLGERQS